MVKLPTRREFLVYQKACLVDRSLNMSCLNHTVATQSGKRQDFIALHERAKAKALQYRVSKPDG
jgi:hypothetical protein